jgi:glycosyltransferase involved in cell wall biosynthesis
VTVDACTLVQFRPYTRERSAFGDADAWGANVAHHDLVECLLGCRAVRDVLFVDVEEEAGSSPTSQALVRERFGGVAQHGPVSALEARARAGQPLVLLDGLLMMPQVARVRQLLCPAAPVLGIVHAVPGPSATGLYHALQADLLAQDAIVATSRAGEAAIRTAFADVASRSRRPHPDIRLIPLGVHAGMFDAVDAQAARASLHLPASRLVILSVGRLDDGYKADLEPLLSTLRRLAPDHDVHLVLAGTDREGYGDRLESLACTYDIADRLTLVRDFPLEQKPTLYAAADIFVSIPNNAQETFGLCLLEAMASGLPVVASDWSGYRDIVVNGESGFLVETSWPDQATVADVVWTLKGARPALKQLATHTTVSSEDLYQRVALLAGRPDLRRRLGEAGRARARRYDWAALGPAYRELIVEKLATRPEALAAVSIDQMYAHYATRAAGRHEARSVAADGTRR